MLGYTSLEPTKKLGKYENYGWRCKINCLPCRTDSDVGQNIQINKYLKGLGVGWDRPREEKKKILPSGVGNMKGQVKGRVPNQTLKNQKDGGGGEISELPIKDTV